MAAVEQPMKTFSKGIATYSGGKLFNTTTTGISGVSSLGSTDNWWSIQANQTGTVDVVGIRITDSCGAPLTIVPELGELYSGNTLLDTVMVERIFSLL